jgi:putative ABC transport system permease protein
MTILTLVLRNLRHYRKPYLAILAGTVISTAVLTGALVVGDSVRYSLVQLTNVRLGKTRYAIQSGDRFFRQKLANELSVQTKSSVAPLLHLEGIAINNEANSRINKVDVIGMDDRFIKFWNTSSLQPANDEAILSQNTAEKLNLNPGDEFLLKIHKQAKASGNAPFVSEKEPVVSFRLKVSAIADDMQMGRFSLKSNQAAPFNLFISQATLARKLELAGNANLLLIAENESSDLTSQKLDSLLQLSWQPEDAGLEFRNIPEAEQFEIRSDRIFIEDNAAVAIQEAIPGANTIFTYLVNDISSNGNSTPYSFVTATDFPNSKLSEHEIIISDWLAADLAVKRGDSIQLRYFIMGAMRKLTEDSARFCIKTILPITDRVFDRTLMPDFPGMSDAGNCRDWETGAPVNLDKIRDKDEQFWNNFRGTPKAFISLAAGQKLWDNAFGHATAFRFPADSSGLQALKKRLISTLVPAENGLNVQDVYAEGRSAAANSTDFGELFLSLSFFIIAAALLLTALLFSLHARKRMSETAILATLGFRKKEIFRILFLETLLIIISGSFLGVVFGIFYNKLLLLGLNTLWHDAVRTSMLEMQILPGTLFTGFAAGLITALFILFFVLKSNLSKPLSVLVKGVEITSPQGNRLRKVISVWVSILLFILAGGFILSSFSGNQVNLSINFLIAGGLILAAGIVALYAALLRASRNTTISSPGFFTAILCNVRMKKSRTIAAIALLAIGTFSVIITGANRKTFYGTENKPGSGTGGFLFWAESTVPILNDLNSAEGKEKYGLEDEKALDEVHFSQFLSLDGNDASCLNLNQVSQPKMLGVNPELFDKRQSFTFVNLDKSVDEQHPWAVLNRQLAPGIIPAFADQTVITWGLRKKVGDTLLFTDESGKILKVKLMGGLDNSVFQGNILVSADLFRQYFPSVSGSKVMLVDGELAQSSEITERLEYLFQDYGMVVTAASERLSQFNSVENTYLTVFMMLGGLGMIIGTVGLGIVLLRNLQERKQEIALYQALGFKRNYILKLVLTENLFILFFGIGIGVISAFAGILPSFFSQAFQLPATFLVVILLLILLSGFAWIYFPVKSALKENLIKQLRKE